MSDFPLELVMYGCEPPRECCELNVGPLEEWPVPLTSELSLQSQTASISIKKFIEDTFSIIMSSILLIIRLYAL